MKIIACIKQVPDSIEVKIDPQTNRIIREDVKGIINPFDMYAVEEAVRLKERFNGQAVVLTMGPSQADTALREALSMGIDEAVLISDRKFVGSDTLATSYALSRAVRKIGGYDIVICGRETIDGSTGQVGPEMAENLGIPCITYVSKILETTGGTIRCVRMMEDHYEEVSAPLPVILTVSKEINEPRIPSLKGLLRAKKAVIPTWTADDIGADPAKVGHDGSPTWVVECWRPNLKKEGRILQGKPQELAVELFHELKKLGAA